jgi:hypothetical protein
VIRFKITTRVVALFVLAFVCLNAAGALCVAYCRSLGSDLAEIESTSHCTRTDPSGSLTTGDSVKDASVDCCPMFVVFAAPIGKQPVTGKTIVVQSSSLEQTYVEILAHLRERDSSFENYRGPPPLDSRTDRIKHRVILI